MSLRSAIALSALAAASILSSGRAGAEETAPGLAAHFQQICGTTAELGPALPGEDIAAADAPGFLATDLGRATESRLVKIGDRYAMRALVPASADPLHAVFLKCAVGAKGSTFSETVDGLSAMLSAKPILAKTEQGFDFAHFDAGMTSFAVFSEPDDWVSVYRMDIMMTNVPRKYLKKGARPLAAPSVR